MSDVSPAEIMLCLNEQGYFDRLIELDKLKIDYFTSTLGIIELNKYLIIINSICEEHFRGEIK